MNNKINKPSKDTILSTNVTPAEKQYVKDMVADQRAADIAEFSKPKVEAPGPADSGVTGHTEYDPAVARNKHFSQKIYLFPESFNALRRELMTYWPHIWQAVGWYMGNNAQEFVHKMNDALDMNIRFDTQKVDAICTAYLNELRSQRGISKLS